jgi:TPR repeat protein/DNA-binding XRE family transcriptional regulator
LQQSYTDQLGSLVRRIREHELSLSQSDLAWLAGVSRGTISNLETGRVTPDTRTWHRIRTALALPPIPLEEAGTALSAHPVLPADAVQVIVDAIVTIRDRDPDDGRRAADRWRRLVVWLTRENDTGWPIASAELSWLADDVAPLIPPGKQVVVYDLLRTWGLVPGPATAEIATRTERAGLQPTVEHLPRVQDLVEQRPAAQNQIQGFDRLPKQVRDALGQGLVVGGNVTTPEASPEVSIVSLIVMNETQSSFTAQNEAFKAGLRVTAVLAVATHIVEKQAPHLSPDEIKQALKVGLDAQSPAEINELLSVARRGDPRAMYELAQLFRKNGRPDEAERWFRRAAEAGHPGALFNLGNLAYEDRRHREAEHWLTEAADAGHPIAPYVLAKLLRIEHPQLAEQWLRRAADAGNRDAMYDLWLLHKEDPDPGQAEQWLRRAANYGHRRALSDLSDLVTERGPEKEAIRWLHRAAEEGDTGAMRRLEIMLYEMRPRPRPAARDAG